MLNGKVAIVTGGSRGIGAAVARELASRGTDIAVLYAGNQELAERVCGECRERYGVRAGSYCCDVADFEAAKETVARIKEDFGRVDILVNNAGITRDKLLVMMKEEDFDAVLATNLKGAFNMIRHVSSIFIRNKGGRIVNVSSVVGLHGNLYRHRYDKGAVRGGRRLDEPDSLKEGRSGGRSREGRGLPGGVRLYHRRGAAGRRRHGNVRLRYGSVRGEKYESE